MSDYIQIGVTALRDPVTGEALEAVPLYIRRSDTAGQEKAKLNMAPFAGTLAAQVGEYIRETEDLPA